METDRAIIPHKGELLEEAFQIAPYCTIADLGGCWGVNGGYTLHIIDKLGDAIKEAYIVDQHLTKLTRERTNNLQNIKLIRGMLGSEEVKRQINQVDALIMYDILLHQVKPDWNEFIEGWLPHCNMVIVYNQNWIKSHKTIRLIDNGLDWYKLNAVYVNEDSIDNWFSEHDVFDGAQGKLKRDIHNFWQWGINPFDMIDVFRAKNFELVYFRRYGEINKARPWIVNEGMVFVRSRF